MFTQLFVLLAINVVISLSPGIDGFAHLGGFLAGLGIAALWSVFAVGKANAVGIRRRLRVPLWPLTLVRCCWSRRSSGFLVRLAGTALTSPSRGNPGRAGESTLLQCSAQPPIMKCSLDEESAVAVDNRQDAILSADEVRCG